MIAAIAAAAGMACNDPTADITLSVTRTDASLNVAIVICPTGESPGGEFCTEGQDLFSGETELHRNADITIGDNTTEVDAYMGAATGCMEVDVLLEGEVVVDWTTGSGAITCAPASACSSKFTVGGCAGVTP